MNFTRAKWFLELPIIPIKMYNSRWTIFVELNESQLNFNLSEKKKNWINLEMINFTFHVNYWTVKLCNILRIPIIEKRGLRYTKLRTSYSKQKVYYRILFSKFYFFIIGDNSPRKREIARTILALITIRGNGYLYRNRDRFNV